MEKSPPKRNWRVVFAGSPAYAVPSLEALLSLPGTEVVGVLTQKPKPRGRGQTLQASAVGAFAAANGLLVLSPDSVKQPDTQALITALNADVAVVVAYGKIIPQTLLSALPHGWVNAHASLLPRWRGASPIQQAIIAGDQETGVALMQLEAGMDTGPTFVVERIAIEPIDTSVSLAGKLARLNAKLLAHNLVPYLEGQRPLQPQPATGITLAPLLKKDDGVLSFHETATNLERKVRAFTPWPGVTATLNGQSVKILEAATAPGSILPGAIIPHPTGFAIGTTQDLFIPLRVQLPGKKPLTGAEFARGYLKF
mgnify:CR=1 FL=1